MKNYFLGIDAGTESLRAAIFDSQGNCISFASCGYQTQHRRPGWAEQDPKEWEKSLIEAIKCAISKSGVDPKRIKAIGVDGTSCTVVFLDKAGKPVRPAIMWMDVRAHKESLEISSTKHPALKYTGFSRVSPEWFPCKVLWIKKHEPEVIERSALIFEQTDWLIYKLTGRAALNLNTATIRWFYDSRNGGFPKDFYKLIGIEEVIRKIPNDVLKLGTPVGKLVKSVASETGLHPGIPVAQGGADAYVAVIGVNALKPGKFALITGSSNLHIGLCNQEIHAPGVFGSFPDALIPGYDAVEGGQISTGSVVKWFKENLLPKKIERKSIKTGKSIYATLDEIAAGIPIGSEGLIVLEHWQGNRTPWIDPTSRGVIRGLTLRHTTGHIFRAILEGVAYGTALIFETLDKAGAKVDEIVACGGATNSKLWMQIYADTIGSKIVLPKESQAACLGSAILASVASKDFSSIEEAAEAMVQYKDVVEPIAENHEKYRYLLGEYKNTYENLRDSSSRMVQFIDTSHRKE